MRDGYSKNLYGLLRRLLKLPRPTEIWGRKVKDTWSPHLMYFYAKMCFGEAMSHANLPLGVFNTIVGILILFEVKDLASTEIVVLLGVLTFFLVLIFGHILVVIGFMKKQNQLSNSQNPDIIEMRDNIRKLVDKS